MTPDSLRVVVPARVVGGSVTVEQYTGSASLAFQPSVGTLRVVGRLPWGKAVDGIGVEVVQGASVVASGTTGADGTETFSGLYTGSYAVRIVSEPDGFHAAVPVPSVTVSLDATTDVALSVSAEVRSLALAPTALTLAAPGEEGTLTGTARDVDGDVIPSASLIWSRTNPAVIDIAVSGATATVRALAPGRAEVRAEAGAVNAVVPVTVKGAVRGTVKTRGGKAVRGSRVSLFSGETPVAERTTGADGAFRFTGLDLGSYRLALTAPRDGFVEPQPASETVSVAEGAAEPSVAFTVRALVKKITLSESRVVFKAPGQQATLSATATDVDGDAIADASLRWASSDTAVVKVEAQSPSAKLTAISPGNATVTASADGAEASAAVEVHGAVAGQVLYRYGDPFANALLRLLQNGTEVATTTSGADGLFEFVDLAAGAYVVELTLPAGFTADSARRTARVATGQPTQRVTFQVDPEARRVVVVPQADTLQQLDSLTATATAYDARDKAIPDQTFVWAASDTQVVTVRAHSPTATVRAVGPGRALVTATAGSVADTLDVLVRGLIAGTIRYLWGDPFSGATVRLEQAGAEVKPAQTTGADGTFRFTDLDPGSYSLRVDVPFGFGVDGPNPRSVTVGPGLQPLDIRIIAAVQRVVISPENPVLTVGETLDVTATAYDARNNPILQFRTVSWASLEPTRLSAGGTTLTGRLGGVSPSARSGDAPFRIVLNGEAFEFRATVLSYITGTVTDTPGAGVRGVTVGLARTADSTIVSTTTTDGRGQYRFDNLYADAYAVEPVPPAGFVASPRFSVITLGPSTPSGRADFQLAPAGATRVRRPGDIAIYKNYNAWFGENKDESVLQGAPFNLERGAGYFVRSMSELRSGIPSTTSLIILTSAAQGNYLNQITQQNDSLAVLNLELWVRGGGWLVAHLGDNARGIGYKIPGLSGIADDALNCTGLTLTVADHALIRGPDAQLGTADDLNNANIDNGGRFCYDNHGSLAGILPENAEILMVEQGGSQRPVYATYTLGLGRVIVTTLTLEFGPHTLQTLVNHFYWAIYGLDAPRAAAAAAAASLQGPAAPARQPVAPPGQQLRTDQVPGVIMEGDARTAPKRPQQAPPRDHEERPLPGGRDRW